MSSMTLPGPVVPVSWLAQRLQEPASASWLRVIDASLFLPSAGRNALAEYQAGHIPGAVFCDIGWISDETAPFPHTLPSASVFAEKMSAIGIGSSHSVVVYDSSGQNYSAPRIWWMLKTFGHDRVAVLDGGLPKWLADGHAVTSEPSAITRATFTAHAHPSRVRSADDMRGNLRSHAEQVVDARSPGRFQATEPEPRAGVRGGHIPGSVSVHYAVLVNDDGTLRDAQALREIMHTAGLDLAKPIVASCGTGITACAVMLALDAVGVHDTAVYDGSWTEWGSLPDAPVETGPAHR